MSRGAEPRKKKNTYHYHRVHSEFSPSESETLMVLGGSRSEVGSGHRVSVIKVTFSLGLHNYVIMISCAYVFGQY